MQTFVVFTASRDSFFVSATGSSFFDSGVPMLGGDALFEYTDHEGGGSGDVGYEGSPRCILHGERHTRASFGRLSAWIGVSRARVFFL